MRYVPLILVVIAVALAAVALFPLASSPRGLSEETAPTLTYVPSKHIYVDYVADVGGFLKGEIGFDELVSKYYGDMYWVRGKVVSVAVLENVSTPQASEGCWVHASKRYPLIFYLKVEDVIKGPQNLVGKVIRVYDRLVAYEDGKILFTYDHIPLLTGKTYALALRETDKLTSKAIIVCPSEEKYEKIIILNHTTFVAENLMEFLVTSDGHVIYLYDRDALIEADSDYAQVLLKVMDPVVLTYIGNEPHLTGKVAYEEFRSWLTDILNP